MYCSHKCGEIPKESSESGFISRAGQTILDRIQKKTGPIKEREQSEGRSMQLMLDIYDRHCLILYM